MLQTNQINIVDIEKVGGAAIGVDIFLHQFKANARRIGIASLGVVDGQGDAGGVIILGGDGLAQIGGKRGNTALARQIVADEANAIDC